MTKAELILGLAAIAGCLTVLLQYLTNRRQSAKSRSEAVREEEEAEPFFKWGGGSTLPAPAINRVILNCEFTNEGGAVTDLEIKGCGDNQATITRKDHIGEHEPGKVEFSIVGANVIPDVAFEIAYTTRLNKRSKQGFFWPANGEPQRVAIHRVKRDAPEK
jgi:hypothetical protein